MNIGMLGDVIGQLLGLQRCRPIDSDKRQFGEIGPIRHEDLGDDAWFRLPDALFQTGGELRIFPIEAHQERAARCFRAEQLRELRDDCVYFFRGVLNIHRHELCRTSGSLLQARDKAIERREQDKLCTGDRGKIRGTRIIIRRMRIICRCD